MGYTELIKVLESLPSERRAEVFDFAEFLAARCREESAPAVEESSRKSLADLLADPLKVEPGFTVSRRDELYDRAGLR